MVPSRIDEAEPTQLKDNERDRHSLFLQQARGISSIPESNDGGCTYPLKLNEEEPWERSLIKLLGDSSSSLYLKTARQESMEASGIFRLEHSESRDRCSETEHPEEFSVTPAPSRSFVSDIYRTVSAAPRDVSLMDSSLDDASETTDSSTTSKFSPRGPYHPRSSAVRSADNGLGDEYRQDHTGYRELMTRRSHICLVRQQRRDLFASTAQSFDDVTHFNDEINLPFLPSLDEPSGMDDSNTVRRLPPRYDDVTTALLGEMRVFDLPPRSNNHDRVDETSRES